MNGKRATYSLRSFISELHKIFPDEIVEIEQEVSTQFETTAYYLAMKKANPAILFRKLSGFPDFSIVTNVFGSGRRLAGIAGFASIEDFINGWSLIANSSAPSPLHISESSAPFKETVFTEYLDIFKLPVPSHYELDGSNKGFSRYITAGLTTTIDPENSEIINLSFSRIQPFGRNKFAFDAGSHGHLWKYLNLSRERGERMEMTVAMGCNPILYILAASFIDNEFGKVSKFFDINFSNGYKNHIPIPTDSEIVMEAEFIPDETFEEGPFSEYAGYMGYDSTGYVAKVKSIMMRRNPIYYDIQPSNSSEHVNLFSFPRSALVTERIRDALPKGPDYTVHWPHYGGRFLALAYVDRSETGLGSQLGLSILGLDPLWNKIVFVNEGKFDLTLESALANLTKFRVPGKVFISRIPNTFIISSDPSRDKNGTSGKIIIVTSGPQVRFKKKMTKDSTILTTEYGDVLVSNDYSERKGVNVVVPEDIQLDDFEHIGWALSTRMNPDRDLKVTSDTITFLATEATHEIASIPEEVRNKIEKNMAHFA